MDLGLPVSAPSPAGGVAGDGFLVELDAVMAASQAIARQKEAPLSLGRALRGVRTVQTGDASLDQRIGSLVDRLDTVLTRLSEALGADADGLSQVSDNYRSADAEVAASAGNNGASGDGAASGALTS
jgi:hypothetical protein